MDQFRNHEGMDPNDRDAAFAPDDDVAPPGQLTPNGQPSAPHPTDGSLVRHSPAGQPNPEAVDDSEGPNAADGETAQQAADGRSQTQRGDGASTQPSHGSEASTSLHDDRAAEAIPTSSFSTDRPAYFGAPIDSGGVPQSAIESSGHASNPPFGAMPHPQPTPTGTTTPSLAQAATWTPSEPAAAGPERQPAFGRSSVMSTPDSAPWLAGAHSSCAAGNTSDQTTGGGRQWGRIAAVVALFAFPFVIAAIVSLTRSDSGGDKTVEAFQDSDLSSDPSDLSDDDSIGVDSEDGATTTTDPGSPAAEKKRRSATSLPESNSPKGSDDSEDPGVLVPSEDLHLALQAAEETSAALGLGPVSGGAVGSAEDGTDSAETSGGFKVSDGGGFTGTEMVVWEYYGTTYAALLYLDGDTGTAVVGFTGYGSVQSVVQELEFMELDDVYAYLGMNITTPDGGPAETYTSDLFVAVETRQGWAFTGVCDPLLEQCTSILDEERSTSAA